MNLVRKLQIQVTVSNANIRITGGRGQQDLQHIGMIINFEDFQLCLSYVRFSHIMTNIGLSVFEM